jgi:hypothetical protein
MFLLPEFNRIDLFQFLEHGKCDNLRIMIRYE